MITVAHADAIAFAAHFSDVDKGGRPYIEHCRRVAAQMDTDEEKIVALLHDVLEDHHEYNILLRQLLYDHEQSSLFWDVLHMAHFKDESYDEYIQILLPRPICRKVKIADLRDNMDLSRLGREPNEKDLERQAKYQKALDVLLAYE